MDGKITGVIPHDKFSFDLQRFTGDEPAAGEGSSTPAEGGETPATDPSEGALFSVTTGTGEQATTQCYKQATDFVADKFTENSTVKLLGDISLSTALTLSNTCTLDLNGHNITSTLSSTEGRAIKVSSGTFTLQDTSAEGNGKITANSSSSSASGSDNNNTIYIGSSAKFVMEGGTVENITNKGSIAVNTAEISATSSTDDVHVQIKGGTISGTYCGLWVRKGIKANVTGSAKITAENSTLDVYAIVVAQEAANLTIGSADGSDNPIITANSTGTAQVDVAAISGIGNDKDAGVTLTVNSGTITGTGGHKSNLGIYFPTINGNLNIKGGTITGGDDTIGGVGVEVRAGTLNVTGGTIEGKGNEYKVESNGDGSAAKSGVGISIAQHQTKKKIEVKIGAEDGTKSNINISGANAIALSDPEKNAEINDESAANDKKIGQTEVTINDGTFTSTVKTSSTSSTTGGSAILIDDAKSTVTVNNATFDGNVTVGENAAKTQDKKGSSASSTNNPPTAIADGESKQVKAASITINNATVNGDVVVVENAKAQETTKVDGGSPTTEMKTASITLNDGTYNGEIKDNTVDKTTEGGTTTTTQKTITVKSGTYTNAKAAAQVTELLDEAVETTTDENGKTRVVKSNSGWVKDSSKDTVYSYYLGTDTSKTDSIVASVTLATAGDSSSLTSDSLYSFLGIPANVTGFSLGAASVGFALAKYDTGSAKDITITPQTSGVKIKGTNFIGSDVTVLSASLDANKFKDNNVSLGGVYVDATKNGLVSLVGGDGWDYFIAGSSGGTLDGGKGNDTLAGGSKNASLKGGEGNDLFIYSGGNDIIADYGGTAGTDTDKVELSGVNAVTDGSKLGTVNGGDFRLTFSSGNTLTFQGSDVVATVMAGTQGNFVYTKDAIIQGSGATLGAGTTTFDVNTQDSLQSIVSIDASAVTGNLTITDNDQSNYITFSTGANKFNYASGSDTIVNYTSDDTISITTQTPPTSFDNVNYNGSDFVIGLGGNDSLTFKSSAEVALLKTSGTATDTYSYTANSIALEGKGISLGAGYTSTQYNGTSTEYATIDAANVTQKIRIRGNDKKNYIVSSSLGGVLEGNDEGDTLNGSGATDSLTLNGGAGNDLLEGGGGYNYFIYSEGSDSIKNYRTGNLINVTGREVSFADVTVDTDSTNKTDLLIKFDNSNQLSIAGGASSGEDDTVPVISLTSGRNNYAVTKDYIALNGKSITLAAGYGVTGTSDNNRVFNGADDANTVYAAINAAAVTATGGISIVGNDNNNYIIGSESNSNSLNGGAGDDTLVGNTVDSAQPNLFYYTAGKDVIENFGASKDKLDISDAQVEKIASGKLTNSKLTFTVDKNNSLTFKFGDNEPFEKVSLNSDNSAYLTKDGVVSIPGGTGDNNSLKLFASAKGKIDLNDGLYSLSSAAIATVDASAVKSQSVTLVGGTKGGLFAYMENNKQRDGFEYGGGTVSISGYEGGRDRIDLGDDSLTKFEIIGSGDNKDVKLTLGDSKTISIKGAAGKEVLLRDTSKGNGYKKMVFAATGVVQNKAKNPTMATVSAGVDSYSFADSNHNAQTVKKIYVTDVAAGASIRAGDKYNTVIDASKATSAVSLSGGAKNDKLIGSTGDAADLFVYTGGKDVIQNFGGSDQISLATDFKASLETGKVKITAAKKSIKFKFGNKDVLTIKSNDTMSGALKINDDNNIYFKNAIGDSNGSVSLTSGFSGTFRTQDTKRTALPTAKVVNGSKVEKNLTFVGSSANETLIGGYKSNKKTMFKGGGGADSLVGGASKDTFFYAKGNTGDANIANFDFANDKIKVSSGIISKIENSGSEIKFSMTNGKSTDAAVGSFNITSGNKNGDKVTNFSKVAIKANNTYYWFAEDDKTYYSASTGDTLAPGTLITTENRLKNMPSGCDTVLDLNYSTNLAKNDIVAVKATTTKPTTTTT